MSTLPDPFARFLDELLASPEARKRDGALLQLVVESGAAGAAALWLPDPNDTSRWISTLERGPASHLPDHDEVEAVRRGALGPELPLDRVVLVSEELAGGAALALGDVGPEEMLDSVEGLFRVWACVVAADEVDAAHPADSIAAPLARHDASMELRAFLDAVDGERPAFRRLGFGLTVETNGEVMHYPPALGERRLFHVVRSLLGEVRTTLEGSDERGGTVRVCCSAQEDAFGIGWELAGSLERNADQPQPAFRLWLPALAAAA